MNHIGKQSKHTLFYRITLWIALAFLVVGLAFLGSFRGTGSAFELKAKSEGDAETPSVVFRLSNLTEEQDGKTVTTKLRVIAVYANVGAVYQSVGKNASVRIAWATSGSNSFNSVSRRADLTVENFVAETSEKEGEEQVKEGVALYDWGAFSSVGDKWTVASYPNVQLTSLTCNVLINEIVFVGEKLNDAGEGTGELCVVPAEVSSATPLVGQKTEEAAAAAGAMLDRQGFVPNVGGYRFFSYSAGERTVLASISEMRAGNVYGEGNIYEGERVYGAFGVDILALGTLIFGMNPFGLRFFSMLAAFGALLFGAALTRKLSGSDKAGMIFAILFALAGMTFAYGGLGTPLMLGVFFLLASADLCHRFYAYGMQHAGFVSALPLLFSGLAAACAVSIHGALILPVAGVALLFAAGMVRQARARRYYLDKAIAEAESAAPASEDGSDVEELPPAKQKVADVVAEYRYKNASAVATFAASFVIGALVIALLAILPAYFAYVKLYDNPAAPSRNLFYLMWKGFAGGFAGVNAGASAGSPWNIFTVLLRSDGAAYSSVWGAFVNPVCLLAILAAIAYCVWRIVCLIRTKGWGKPQLKAVRALVIPLVFALLASIAAIVSKDAVLFVVLVYFFVFAIVADAVALFTEAQGRTGKVCRICAWVAFGLLAAMFALYFVFLTGLPVSSGVIAALFA